MRHLVMAGTQFGHAAPTGKAAEQWRHLTVLGVTFTEGWAPQPLQNVTPLRTDVLQLRHRVVTVGVCGGGGGTRALAFAGGGVTGGGLTRGLAPQLEHCVVLGGRTSDPHVRHRWD